MPLFSTFQDDFQSSTIDTGRWPARSGVTAVGGQARLAGNAYLQTTANLAIAGSSIYARILLNPLELSDSGYLQFSVHKDADNWVGARIIAAEYGNSQFLACNGGVLANGALFQYGPVGTDNLWLRIRHDGTTFALDIGNNLAAPASSIGYSGNAWNPTATMYARIQLVTTTNTVAWVDNVNLNSALRTSTSLLPTGATSAENVAMPDGPVLMQANILGPFPFTDAGTVTGAGVSQPYNLAPATTADTDNLGTPLIPQTYAVPTSVTTTELLGGAAVSQVISAAYGDNIYGQGVYNGTANQIGPVGVGDADYILAGGTQGGTQGGPVTVTGYGSGTYSDGVYSGTPTDPNQVRPATIIDGELLYGDDPGDAYGSGPYGRGAYQSRNIGNTNSGYGSGIYGDGIYQGTIKQPGGAATPATLPITQLWPNPTHILGIGPWNPTKVWHGAVNYGIGRGLAPARPVMQLPGITAKSVTLRLTGGDEATVTCQFATTDAVIVREMATDLWWLRKDPRSGQLDMLGRFNCSHNDLTRADDGLLSSSLQFQDWKIVLGNRMVLKYLKPNLDPPESQWAKGTSITEILKFAIPTDTGIDLSILDKEDVLGNTTEAYHLPPYNTIDQTIEALLAISPKPWEWWIDTTSDFAYPPKLTLATQRGTDRGVTLFDLGAGTSPIASWQMRATSDNYANTIYFQGGGVNNTAAGGVVRTFAADVAEVGERDVQVSDNSIVGALANYTAAADKALKPLADRRPTFTITLKAGFWRGRHHIDVGDTVRVRIKLGKELLAYTYRVSEIHVDIDQTGSETVALTLGNPLASANPRSQYSPVFKLVRTLRNYTPPVGSTS